jgi:hypothetical protein
MLNQSYFDMVIKTLDGRFKSCLLGLLDSGNPNDFKMLELAKAIIE